MKRLKATLAKSLNYFGNILIIVSLIVLFLTFGPAVKEEVKYQTTNILDISKSLNPPNTDFSIVIPKISAAAPVFVNTDPYDPTKYLPILKEGVAHANGTSYPGESGNTYLFAHSTESFYNVGKYNAVFYLLGKLNKDDEIFVYYKGKKIKYLVDSVKVVEPEDIKYLGTVSDGNTLTLQTCYPPGTTLKRLIVVANQQDY
uniref:Putative sortase n=1 Tax=uncultured Microgenomates bacterium Rifle_16ft_4_minimus_38077 TaxID=1665117 RepID=A0A0H4T6T0_9BACT|nr:putative sortase [uncultured Microgenomates bacterium Rifle_16ft_4_minimus_38077]